MQKIGKKVMAVLLSLLMVVPFNYNTVAADSPEIETPLDQIPGTTYYVDSETGDNVNAGTDQSHPWKDLDKVNQISFLPGDQILFKSGTTYTGALVLQGSGSEALPITVDKYGGEDKPIIQSQGEAPYAVHLKNVEYVTVKNLEITNTGADRALRAGVFVEANNFGVMDGICLSGLYVHDVNGTLDEKTEANGGIYCNVTDESRDTRFNNLVVENCVVKNVSRTGISVGMTSSFPLWDGHGGIIPEDILGRYGHTGVRIRNNYVENSGGDAIVPMFSIKPVIEYNISNGASQNTKDNPSAMYNAGIWPWRCEDAVFQFNEVFNTVNNGDGQAYDCDWSRGTIYQYNYSHDNEGGFILVCQSEALDSVIRYNISQNDRRCLFLASNPNNADVYNNTFYIGEGLNTQILEDYSGNLTLKNNIFYNLGTVKTPKWGSNFTYDNNLYYGYDSSPEDDNKIISDPQFKDPGKGGTGAAGNSAIDTLSGYRLSENSPAINAGLVIENHGGRDYEGNFVGTTTPDIGAMETNVEDVFLKSDIYEINQKENRIILTEDVGIGDFLKNIKYTDGAAVQIKKNGIILTEGTLTEGCIVVVQKGDLQREYSVKVNRVYPDPLIESDTYYIDQNSGTIFLEKATDITEFLSYLQYTEGLEITVKNQGTVVEEGLIADGFVVAVDSGNKNKVYRVMVFADKNKYDLSEDFIDGVQGPVWFHEYQDNGERSFYTNWVEEWRCWTALGDRLTSGIENNKGLIAPTQGADTIVTWVAPKDGVVELSTKHLTSLRRQWQTSGNMGIRIEKNDEVIMPEKILEAQAELSIHPVLTEVKKGDKISFIANFKGNLTDSSSYFTPVAEYLDYGSVVQKDLTDNSVITASSTENGYDSKGLTDFNRSATRNELEWKAQSSNNQWIEFTFPEESEISEISLLESAIEGISGKIRCSFSDGTSVDWTPEEAVNGVYKLKLDDIVKTSFVKMEFLNTEDWKPALGDVQIMDYRLLHTYTITLNDAEAITVIQITDPENTLGEKLPVPEKEGYLFKGWNTQQDGKGETVTGDTVITTDLTLYAIYVESAVTEEPVIISDIRAENGKITLTLNREPEGEIKAVDFYVELNLNNVGYQKLEITSFEYDGERTVILNFKEIPATDKAQKFTVRVEFHGEDVESKVVTIPKKYVKPENPKPPQKGKNQNQKPVATGDTMPIAEIITMFLVSGIVLLVLIKKRKIKRV